MLSPFRAMFPVFGMYPLRPLFTPQAMNAADTMTPAITSSSITAPIAMATTLFQSSMNLDWLEILVSGFFVTVLVLSSLGRDLLVSDGCKWEDGGGVSGDVID